jgi:hypothetical protein
MTRCIRLALASVHAFSAALEAIPPEDMCRTWAAVRTIMLKMTLNRNALREALSIEPTDLAFVKGACFLQVMRKHSIYHGQDII